MRGRAARSTVAAAAVGALLLGAAPAGAAEGPPATPGTQQVLYVANNWDGTADLVDQESFQVLKRLNLVPDLEERMAEISTDPERLAYFLAIRQFIGEGNDQFADDMYTSRDGRTVYVSRPSLADVVGIDIASGEVVWRFPMEGQRSDHMGMSPDGRTLAVSDSTANKVHLLDAATGEKVGEFPSGDSPHENTYSRDGSTLYHASIGLVYTPLDQPAFDTTKGERILALVDTETLDVDLRDLADDVAALNDGDPSNDPPIVGEGRPDSSAVRPMAVPPGEEVLYLQLSFFHGYVVYDIAQDAIVQVVNLPNLVPDVPREQYLLDSAHHGLAIDPTGEKLCVAGTMSDYAAVVPVDDPLGGMTMVQGITKPYWSTNSGDGEHCFVSASGDDEVVVLSYATGAEVTRIPVGDHPQRMRLGLIATDLLAAETPATAVPARPAAPGTAARTLAATGWPLAAPAALVLVAAAAVVRRRRR
ncbi:MAG: YncE family protein [Actinomycetes bacterium]